MGLAVSAGSALPRPESDHCTRTQPDADGLTDASTRCLKGSRLCGQDREPSPPTLPFSTFRSLCYSSTFLPTISYGVLTVFLLSLRRQESLDPSPRLALSASFPSSRPNSPAVGRRPIPVPPGPLAIPFSYILVSHCRDSGMVYAIDEDHADSTGL